MTNIYLARHQHFVYHQSMDVDAHRESAISGIAAAIGEPARARMLYCLLDGRARTSTELAVVADVTPSTASVHLQRLNLRKLVRVLARGKHRYYSLEGPDVAAALEALSVVAGGSQTAFVPNTPNRLRRARTCYDHIAGTLGVALHDYLQVEKWLVMEATTGNGTYSVTPVGARSLHALGIDLDNLRSMRRRFAYACVDWSERRPHLGGALGAAILKHALGKAWVAQEADCRALRVTNLGKREWRTRFGVSL
jgi:DNA-binding transcriptional ArsR family regulator